ncbi:MAG: chemotaxis protein CheW [Proteobacteria bacterium]|nr:chemotaxis protein CheW [Pseudomonadota bacterium]
MRKILDHKEHIIIDWKKIHQKLKDNGATLFKAQPNEHENRNILKKRAEKLATEVSQSIGKEEKINVLKFQIGTEKYAIEVSYINKVYLLKDLVPLPGVSSHIVGIINIRGHILPIIDFKKIFDLSVTEKTTEKVIVITANEANYGILAQEVLGLEEIGLKGIQHDLPTLTDIRVEYIKGISAHQTIILDPLKIATHKSIVMNDV